MVDVFVCADLESFLSIGENVWVILYGDIELEKKKKN